jgi:hypothetical protein
MFSRIRLPCMYVVDERAISRRAEKQDFDHNIPHMHIQFCIISSLLMGSSTIDTTMDA